MTALPTSVTDPAIFHRPAHVDGLRAAAELLARQGLTCRDIAAALGLTSSAVVQLLGGRTS